MEPSSSSGESIRSIETYANAANHPMPAIVKARRVVLLCGLFGVRRSHDRYTPFIAETNRPTHYSHGLKRSHVLKKSRKDKNV